MRGAVKPARAIAHDEASSAGLSQCADLENWLQETTNGGTQGPKHGELHVAFRMTWLVLSTKRWSPNR